MHIKRIHEMVEKLTECTLSAINENKSNVGDFAIPDVVDMIKDLCEAEKLARIAKEMEKSEEEDEAEEKHFIKMLKEQYKDEYKEMKEQYGDEADRRFYDSWRHAGGSFAKKGTGEYRPRSYYRRRGYVEPMYHMPLNMYHDYSPEELRDLDRDTRGVMYYTPSGGGNMGGGGNSSGSNGNSGNSGGNTRSYTDGFNDGQTRGYSEGYERGRSDGSRNNSSRYDNARRGYSETKQNHKGNSPEDNTENMRSLEKLLNIIAEDVKEYAPSMSQSEKAMARQKIEGMAKGIQ